MPYVLRNANKKTLRQIHGKIETARYKALAEEEQVLSKPVSALLLRFSLHSPGSSRTLSGTDSTGIHSYKKESWGPWDYFSSRCGQDDGVGTAHHYPAGVFCPGECDQENGKLSGTSLESMITSP